LVGVATNQAGVARGYFHEADVVALHQWMSQALAEQGARIDAFAFCPHHPQGVVLAYRRDCDCRKPAPGMIQRLLGLFDVEPRFAAMIGDKDSDLEAARAAGVEAVRFTEGSLMDTAGPVIDRLVGLTQVIESPMASSS
jgi:D-glycero-D-manno-heptose 1,7-bisphosphate phosphatase